jgi:4-diphosphocytidyl-2-C-methyl-D-erythritol kinase
LARSDFLAIVAGFPAYSQDLEPDKSSATGLDGFDDSYAKVLSAGFGRNDLQKPAEACCEEVVQALAMLKDRFGNSRMTGSGSAVFARIEDEASLSDQPLFSQDLPAGWIGKTCNSLDRHPLQGWSAD